MHKGLALSTCKYKRKPFISLFVATNERGPGGMRQVTEMERKYKVRRQVPLADPLPPGTE